MKPRKERIRLPSNLFAIDSVSVHELRIGTRKWGITMYPINLKDFEEGKLKLKEGMQIIRIEEIVKIGGEKGSANPYQH